MTAGDALLLAYDAFGGSIQGKTNLQKKMYFLGVMMNEDFGYGPHYYGPYSARVAAANQELKSLGYLSESTISAGGVNAFGFEMARHDFYLTEDGLSVLKDKKARLASDWARLESAANRLTKAGSLNYMEISIAAKSHFLLQRQGTPTNADELAKLADKFGWTVSAAEIQKAVEFLAGLELARIVE